MSARESRAARTKRLSEMTTISEYMIGKEVKAKQIARAFAVKIEFTWKVRQASKKPDKTSSASMDDFTESLEASVANIEQGNREETQRDHS